MGVDPKEFCAGVKQGRVYPQPSYAPSIFEVKLDRAAGTFAVSDTIPLNAPTARP